MRKESVGPACLGQGRGPLGGQGLSGYLVSSQRGCDLGGGVTAPLPARVCLATHPSRDEGVGLGLHPPSSHLPEHQPAEPCPN